MSGAFRTFVAAGGLALLWGAAAPALEIGPTAQERVLVGDVEAAAGMAFRIEQAGDAAPDLDPFDSIVEVDAVVPGATASAIADQTSSIGATQGSATGGAAAATDGDADDGFGFAIGDSFFDLSFVPDEDLRFRVQGQVQVFGDELGEMFASVFLVDLDSGLEVFGIGLDLNDLCDPCGPVPFDFIAPLEQGREYALTAFATAVAPFEEVFPVIPALAGGTYALEYSLLPIPEPSAAQLIGLGLIGLGLGSRLSPRAPSTQR